MPEYNGQGQDEQWVNDFQQAAIEVKGYTDFMPLGGNVIPMRGSDSIMWTVKFRNGKLKRFRFKGGRNA